MKLRKENDSMGTINVSDDKYWGASTERSKKFWYRKDISSKTLINAIATVKLAAANDIKNKQIDSKICNAIVRASKEIISGKLDGNFPLKVWQTGSGTQTNMNVNEVIANRAIQILGGKMGTKKPVHPNDHVNKSQSTNDVFPTAMHIAIAIETKKKLLPSLKSLSKELKAKIKKFRNIVKVGRTHLQDATPLTLGQEFSGYYSQLNDCISRIESSLKEIYYLAQGGTAVGTELIQGKFWPKICKEISKITKIKFYPAKQICCSRSPWRVNFSGTLNTLQFALWKLQMIYVFRFGS